MRSDSYVIVDRLASLPGCIDPAQCNGLVNDLGKRARLWKMVVL